MKVAPATQKRLLESLSWRLMHSADYFDPAEKFIEKADIDDVSLIRVNEAFKDNFLQKKEAAIKAGIMQISRPAPGTEANDAVIIYDLLMKSTQILSIEFAVTLCHIWEFLKQQPDGRDGRLTTADNEKNVFYSENAKGILMPVEVYWEEEENERKRLRNSGWVIESYPDSPPFRGIIGRKLTPVYNRMRRKNDQIFWFQSA